MRGEDFKDTEIISMLRFISEHWRGRVILELMPTAILLAQKEIAQDQGKLPATPSGLLVPTGDIIDTYQMARNTFEHIFA